MQQLIRRSSPEIEGQLQGSKARKFPILIDLGEMQALLNAIGEMEIFDASRPVNESESIISQSKFLKAYRTYIEGIKAGKLIDEDPLRPFFSSFFSSERASVYAMELPNGKLLLKTTSPIIQLKRHHFIFSGGEFHSGVMGKESVSWGIEFSYPSLFLDPKTKAIVKVDGSFPNTALFQRLAKWVRCATLPTPFLFDGEQVNVPMRIGKNCLEWINNHPSLKARSLYVGRKTHPSISN